MTLALFLYLSYAHVRHWTGRHTYVAEFRDRDNVWCVICLKHPDAI